MRDLEEGVTHFIQPKTRSQWNLVNSVTAAISIGVIAWGNASRKQFFSYHCQETVNTKQSFLDIFNLIECSVSNFELILSFCVSTWLLLVFLFPFPTTLCSSTLYSFAFLLAFIFPAPSCFSVFHFGSKERFFGCFPRCGITNSQGKQSLTFLNHAFTLM